jgi:hypothetical protein
MKPWIQSLASHTHTHLRSQFDHIQIMEMSRGRSDGYSEWILVTPQWSLENTPETHFSSGKKYMVYLETQRPD